MESRFDNESVYDLGKYLSARLITTPQYQDHMYVALANITLGTPLPPWTSREFFFQPHTTINPLQNTSQSAYKVVTRGFGATANCTSVAASTMPINTPKAALQSTLHSCANPVDTAESRMRQSTNTRSRGRSAVEYCSTLSYTDDISLCDSTLTLGWARSPEGQDVNATTEASFATCNPVFETASFEVEIDHRGYVMSYQRLSEIQSGLDYPHSSQQGQAMVINANHLLNHLGTNWHNDTLSRDWMNYFISELSGSRTVLDPTAPVPNPETLIPFVEETYRLLFAILLDLNQQLFVSRTTSNLVQGQRLAEETRIFMDRSAFIIVMMILAINIVGAAAFYLGGVVFVLPRMPTTIGSILAYVAPSRMAREHGGVAIQRASRTLTFGRYRGLDGQVHLGIERDPYVVPIDPSSLQERTSWISRVLRLNRAHMREIKNGPWL